MSSASERKAGRPPNEAMREQRREEILAAAVRLFAERGYAEADTQVLADMLGVGKGTLYRYFPSKRELFLAAVDGAMRKLKAAVDEAIEGDRGTGGADRRGNAGLSDFFRGASGVRRVNRSGAGAVQGPEEADVFRASRRQRRSLAGVVRLPDCPGPFPGHSRGENLGRPG